MITSYEEFQRTILVLKNSDSQEERAAAREELAELLKRDRPQYEKYAAHIGAMTETPIRGRSPMRIITYR